jgi:hypothetical protein
MGSADLPSAELVVKDFHSEKTFSPLFKPNERVFSLIGMFSRGLQVEARGEDKLFLRLWDVGSGALVRGFRAEATPALRGIPVALTGVLLQGGADFFLLESLFSEVFAS